MKAIILNSGIGSRLGYYTKDKTKCMVPVKGNISIIQHQLKQLKKAGITEVIITTGYMREVLEQFVENLEDELEITFVNNPDYITTNYIKSLELVECENDDVILLHGDLIFESRVLSSVVESTKSCMIIDRTLELPSKDFKAKMNWDRIEAIGISYFGDDCVAAQPMYKLLHKDWVIWKNSIHDFCINGNDKVYAEEAFNKVSSEMVLIGIDINGLLCNEIDDEEDLHRMRRILEKEEYMNE
ncbi:MAG: hypothetical protein K0S01_3082 [Herbinix sp.]|jgi:phosphoenolpyruvate phosphomutase|nr:hypothetical protein [Herbinix sp.]